MVRLLVISKNITRGFKSLYLVWKTVFSFIVRLNVDIVEFPAYIKLGDELRD